MKKRRTWGSQLFFAIMLTIICISCLVSKHGRVGAEFFILVVLAAHSWYLVIKFWPKSGFLDAIHDTVHEMARDEARHGVALKGLLERYFK